MSIPLGYIQLIVSPHAPAPCQVRFPPKGPYWRRRNKRWARDPKNWVHPEKPIIIMGNTVICHPYYELKVRRDLGIR